MRAAIEDAERARDELNASAYRRRLSLLASLENDILAGRSSMQVTTKKIIDSLSTDLPREYDRVETSRVSCAVDYLQAATTIS